MNSGRSKEIEKGLFKKSSFTSCQFISLLFNFLLKTSKKQHLFVPCVYSDTENIPDTFMCHTSRCFQIVDSLLLCKNVSFLPRVTAGGNHNIKPP